VCLLLILSNKLDLNQETRFTIYSKIAVSVFSQNTDVITAELHSNYLCVFIYNTELLYQNGMTVNFSGKKFYNIGPRWLICQDWRAIISLFSNILNGITTTF